MKYYLGLDGGGTHTRFLLINELGDAVAQDKNETIHIHQVGTDETQKRFVHSLQNICKQAHINPQDISYAYLGFAGYGEVQAHKIFIDQMVEKYLPHAQCGNDVHVAWAGSLAAQAGIQIVAGTGSIVFAKNTQGQESRCGGWGYFFGDEGSAYWLAQLTLNLFSRQSDGRVKASILLNIMRDYFQLDNDFEIIAYYQSQLLNNRTKIAALAPLLFEAAQAGDQSAMEYIQYCAKEQAITIYTAMTHLEWSIDKIPVSYSGGLFDAGEIILAPLKQELLNLDSRLILQSPILSPILGAVYYAYVLDQQNNLQLIDKLKNIQLLV